MYIRTHKRYNITLGSDQTYYVIVESIRDNDKIRQIPVLNLGTSFDIPNSERKSLIYRIETILSGQGLLWPVSEELEQAAQDLARRIKEERAKPAAPLRAKGSDRYFMEPISQKKFGVAQVAMLAMRSLGYQEAFIESGLKPLQAKVAMAEIAARMEHPASESETFEWLKEHSALGDILNINFGQLSVMQLHRTCDSLEKVKKTLKI